MLISDILSRQNLIRLGIEESCDPSVRDLLNFLESQVRLTFCLFLPVLAAKSDCSEPTIAARSGYGKYLTWTAQLLNLKADLQTTTALQNIELSVREASEKRISGRSLYEWRNLLSHGGIAPDGTTFDRSTLYCIIKAVNQVITANVGHWSVQQLPNESPILRTHDGYYANPLLVATDNSIGFFQEFFDDDSQDVQYVMFDRLQPQLSIPVDQIGGRVSLLKFLQSDLRKESPDVRRFKEAIARDIAAFQDESGPLKYDVDASTAPFIARWSRKTSEGAERRTDLFSIASGSYTRLWKPADSDDPMRSYTDFIKDISNWGVLRGRLREQLRREKLRKDAWATDNLGDLSIPLESLPSKRMTRELETIGESFPGTAARLSGTQSIAERLSEAVEQHSGVPQIFFLTGEAGIGKTHTLLELAAQRLDSGSGDDEQLPMFVYVDCSGVQLRSLNEAIDSAVRETLILTADRIHVLSRNGLVVLLVDGFDELVGGVGYRDALRVLKPTLRGIGESGTMLISARSAYLANQYRQSLNEVDALETLAQHQMLALERWSVQEVEGIFASNESWGRFRSALTAEDKELLGLPFFARVFDSYVSKSSETSTTELPDLVNMLLNAYMEREINKLSGAATELDEAKLRGVLVECAGGMHQDGVRELSLEDFRLYAASGLNIESGFEGRYRELGDRLTVLCGVNSTRGEDGELLFSFDHEIYYDALLVDYIINNFLSHVVHKNRWRNLFDAEVLTATVLKAITRREPGACLQVFRELGGVGGEVGGNLSANVGELFCRYVAAQSEIASLPVFLNTLMSELDLSSRTFNAVRIEGGLIKELTLSAASAGKLTLNDTRVELLTLLDDGGPTVYDNLTLEVLGNSQVGEIQVKDQVNGRYLKLINAEVEIYERLDALGASGIAARLEQLRGSGQNALEIFVEDILNRLIGRRFMVFVVEDKTMTPGASASTWMREPTDVRWAHFINAMIEASIARKKRIDASGQPKWQVSIQVELSKLLARDSSEDDRIAGFWSRIRA
jgi:hypothetical protein